MNFTKYRAGIFTLALLLIIQIAMPLILTLCDKYSPYSARLEQNFRLRENTGPVELQAFVYHIKAAGGYKVVFIGDSVVEGAAVSDDNDTVPAYFKQMILQRFPGEDIKVYNLSIPGNRPADIYFTYKMIDDAHAADMVIMNVNYAFYSDEMLGAAPIARADLFADEMTSADASALSVKYSYADSYSRKAASAWNLYSRREELSFYLFGGNLRDKLFKSPTAPKALPQPQTGDVPWYLAKPYPAEKINHWIAALDVRPLDGSNAGFKYLGKTISQAGVGSASLISFLTPVNAQMTAEYGLIKDPDRFAANISTIKDRFNTAGLPLYDLTQAIPSDDFFDLFHLNAPGNRKLAEILVNDVAEYVRSGVAP